MPPPGRRNGRWLKLESKITSHYVLRIHKPTRVPYVLQVLSNWTDKQIEEREILRGEPNHVILQGRIAKDKKYRRRGIWQQDKDKPRRIYFTCPWCGMIGISEFAYVDYGAESIFCTYGCHRHLTLSYRKQGNELKGFNY